MSAAAKRLDRAASFLVMDQPFWGSLVLQLKRVEDTTIPTACTDGRCIRYNPAFIDTLSDQLCISLLAHEVSHIALGHLWRVGHRDPVKMNIAADFVIHCTFTEYNQGKNPAPLPIGPGWLYDKQYTGKSMEQVYDLLPDPLKMGGGGNGKKSGASGNSVTPGDFTTGPGTDALKGEWQAKVADAARVAQMQGKLPAGLKHLVEEFLNPRVPWETVLREFITARAKDDYSWNRLNRRFLWQKIYVPSLYSQRLGRIGVILDTSGSTASYWDVFLSELRAIVAECRPEKLIALDCDAEVANRREFDPGDPVTLEISGGGGTSFIPGIEAMENEGVEACVYLTDGYGDFPDGPPSYPLLWIMTSDVVPPFGQCVRMSI